MREILFRGKGTHGHKTGKWVYGNYAKDFWGINHKGYGILPIEGGYNEVDPETVGQYTGLTDNNGTKIFEGDIVEFKEENGEIVYDEKQAMFIVNFDTWCTDFDHIYPFELEIIGNIHDNPELLGGE